MGSSVSAGSEDSGQWICETCTLQNSGLSSTCDACRSKKRDVFTEASNRSEVAKSFIENGKKKDNVNASSSKVLSNIDGKDWRCNRCTLLNSQNLQRCSVCESPRYSTLPTLSDIDLDNNLVKKPPILKEISGATAQNPVDLDEEWACQSCTFSCNPIWSTTCQSCGVAHENHNKRKHDRDSPVSPVEITKDRVTFVNRPNSASRIQNSSKDKSSRSESWDCLSCTFKNKTGD